MSQIDVLVAATSRDIKAEGIAAAIAERSDMTLAANRVLTLAEIDAVLPAMPSTLPCALIILGRHGETEVVAERWLSERGQLVVLRVDIIDDLVRLATRNAGLDSLLCALRELLSRMPCEPAQRLSRVDWHSLTGRARSSARPPRLGSRRGP